MISTQNVSLRYGDRALFENVSVKFTEGNCYGIIGANGAGKSTFLKILAGEIEPNKGEVIIEPHKRLSVLKQDHFAYDENKVVETVIMGNKRLYEIMQEKERLYAKEDFNDEDGILLGELEGEFADMDGWNAEADAETMLNGLGITSEFHDMYMKDLDGNQKVKVLLAQALFGDPDILLLDEPTNHLDVDSIRWLENYLSHYKGAVIIVSHDRYFLDEVVDKIWELKDGKITEYWGNYSDYLRQNEEERKNQVAEYEQFVTERARLERAAEEKRKQARKIEQKAKGASKKKSTERGGRLAHQKSMGSKEKKMHNAAKSLEHRIAALGNVEAPEDIRRIRFRQSKALELHNPYPIVGTDITKIFGDKVLFEDASFQIPLAAKVALTGGNGTGKTTLIQMILNYEDGISISPKAKIGYFAQNGYKYNSNQKVLEFMKEDCDYNVSEIRSVLASMGFKQNDIGKSLSILSGGEIMKLLLAKMLMGRYNILLMDEPSNFLDIPSLEALEILMKEYAGTIMFITHDKRLLENVADVIYEIKDKKLNLVR